MTWFSFQFPDFAFSFLSILFEGIPFLLLGSLLSGAIDVFVPGQMITRWMPKRSGGAIALGGLLGMIFPMCECGSVVVIRRFMKKGLPVSSAVAYMLAAPIVNPVVALSTFAAFRGQSPWVMTSLRMAIGFVIACGVAFIIRFIPTERLLQPAMLRELPERRRTGMRIAADSGEMAESSGSRGRLLRATQAATADFLDVTFFFVIGAALAAIFNTSVNQQFISGAASSVPISIVAMMLLAGALALCSTTDAFIAATFTAFPFVAKLAFLTFGPVFDVKLFFLYGMIFRRRFVALLGIGLFLTIALICIRLAVLNL
jgi:uncharacterized membrane protein YraQ (UPF0718 family)